MTTTTRETYNDWLDNNPDALTGKLPASETFGPTIQGEGPHAGRTAYFIRLGGCNLSCTWCDTPYSTGTHGIPLSTIPRVTIPTIIDGIPPGTLVVITGGEPLMHARREPFQALLHNLKALGCEVHIETNGSLNPFQVAAHIDHFTVSPKLGVTMARKRDNPALLSWEPYAHKTIMKFVADVPEDQLDAFIEQSITTANRAGIPTRNVWIMPEGTEPDQLQKAWPAVAQAAASHGINATHRLHTLAWGNERGH